jgi:hypothetical protein
VLEPPDRLGALVDGLMRVWAASDGSTAERSSAPGAEEFELSLRRFLGIGEPNIDPRRIAADFSRALAELSDGGDAELLGWVIAVLERAHAGALGELTVRAVSAVLDEQRRLSPRPELPSVIGRVLLHFATSDASFVFRPVWLDVSRHADDASRRELIVRALAWVARGYATGRFTVGAFADACVVAGAEGVAIDTATAELLVPHLASVAAARGGPTELALLAAMVGSLATPAAAARLSDVLLGGADPGIADGVRMRRLALALHEIERVRDEQRYDEARATLRRVLARQALSADEERTLRAFLGVEDGTVVRRLLGRLPSLTPRGAAVAGDRLMTAPTTPTSPVAPPAVTPVPALGPGDTHDGFFLWGRPKAGKSGFIGALYGLSRGEDSERWTAHPKTATIRTPRRWCCARTRS